MYFGIPPRTPWDTFGIPPRIHWDTFGIPPRTPWNTFWDPITSDLGFIPNKVHQSDTKSAS